MLVFGNILAQALAINVIFAALAYKLEAIDLAGAIAMSCMGVVIFSLLGWRGYLIPIIFFALGSLFTHLGYSRKRALGVAQKNEGKRGAREVLANGSIPTVIALLTPMNSDVKPFFLGFVAAWATALCDTSSTELGSVFGRRAFLIKNLKSVAPGTRGAISIEGTVAGFAAALILVFLASTLGLVDTRAVIPLGIAALVGNLAESLMWEYNSSPRAIVHDALNFANTLIGGGLGLAWGFVTIT